jgi:hypothetical protein
MKRGSLPASPQRSVGEKARRHSHHYFEMAPDLLARPATTTRKGLRKGRWYQRQKG